eukprot:GHVS01107638.1.p1 GENE.GHVS01107638.1~~GHVS01107638.1.p1  ORF type:complete len:398 (-),score=43.70 GHVS01107638.1:539-1732(-)
MTRAPQHLASSPSAPSPPVPSDTFYKPKKNTRKQCPYTAGSSCTIDKCGRINYCLSGPSNGPLVVCLHGMSASLGQFCQLADKLNRYRFRVLRFDFWGHGLSSGGGRGVAYSPETFADQLFFLVDHLGLAQTPFSLVGFSMGGLVAVHVANQPRFQTNRICLVSAAGLIKEKPRRINAVLGCASPVTIPLVKYSFLKCFIKRKHMEDGFYNPSKFSDEVDERYHRFRYKHRRNIETSLRVAKSMPFWENYVPYQQLAETQKPVCLLYGADDDISPPQEFDDFLRKTFGSSNFLLYKECKHLVLIEQFEAASEDILYFLLGGQPGGRRFPNPVPVNPQVTPRRSRPAATAETGPPAGSSPEDRDAAYSVGTAGNKLFLNGGVYPAYGGGYGNVRSVRM